MLTTFVVTLILGIDKGIMAGQCNIFICVSKLVPGVLSVFPMIVHHCSKANFSALPILSGVVISVVVLIRSSTLPQIKYAALSLSITNACCSLLPYHPLFLSLTLLSVRLTGFWGACLRPTSSAIAPVTPMPSNTRAFASYVWMRASTSPHAPRSRSRSSGTTCPVHRLASWQPDHNHESPKASRLSLSLPCRPQAVWRAQGPGPASAHHRPRVQRGESRRPLRRTHAGRATGHAEAAAPAALHGQLQGPAAR